MANKKKAQSVRFAVSATREGFRRAGRSWSTVPVELDASELNKDQWKLLRQDPMIQVTQIGGEVNPSAPQAAQEAAPAAAEEQQEATSEEQQEAAPAEQDKAAQSPTAKA